MKEYLYQLATDQLNNPLAQLMKLILWVGSILYGMGVWCILFLYKIGILQKERLTKPVICVGNITLGGVGKTPLVELIAQTIRNEGIKPAILTRGYMPSSDSPSVESQKNSDEAEMLRENLKDVPIIVGGDRVTSAKKYLERNSVDVFVMDDGFQHWRLFRDIDIVAIDATSPFGNGHLLPRGILREQVSSLARASVFVLTRIDLGKENLESIKEKLKKINPDTPIVETMHEPRGLINEQTGSSLNRQFLEGKRVCSLCSIGNPDSFQRSLKRLGVQIETNFVFMDHYQYTPNDIQAIVEYCKARHTEILVTTQKDAVKLKKLRDNFGNIQLFSLKIAINIIKGKDEFYDRVLSYCNR